MKTVENNNKKHNNNSSVQMRLVVPIAFIICLLVIATLFLPHLLSPASGYTYDEYGNVVFTPTPGSVFTPLPSVTIDTPLPTTSPSDEDLIILKEGMDSYLVMDMQKALTVLRYFRMHYGLCWITLLSQDPASRGLFAILMQFSPLFT